MKAYELQSFGIDGLKIVERERPSAGETDVVVRFHAASLNFRDLMMIKGRYDPRLNMPLVPFSDGAGEVVEVGTGVSKWQIGDRVMPIFMQGWLDGRISYEKAKTALGGDVDGVLREFGAFDQHGLVKIPEHLSFEEAATLPCAALTAFNALFESGRAAAGESVLLLGTGGVSIFALQFAAASGLRAIITSSSDEKLQKAMSRGANDTINYHVREDWDQAVLALTEKRGVDHIVEVGGAGTMQKSLNCVKIGGHIAVIGVLAGKGEFDSVSVLMKAVRLHGIFVGSREMFETMNGFIEQHRIAPVIDRTFGFDEARDALRYMESGSHFGKIVVRI